MNYQIGSLINKPDLWLEKFYGKTTFKKQYDYILQTIEFPLNDVFNDEIDIVDFLLEILDGLTDSRDYQKLDLLIKSLKKNQPDLYNDCYYFFNNELLNYYCFTGDKDGIKQMSEQFIKNPTASSDYLIPVMKNITFNGYTDIALKLTKKVFGPINKCQEISDRADRDIAFTFYYLTLQVYYSRYLKEDIFDWKAFKTEIKKLDIDTTEDFMKCCRRGMLEPIMDLSDIEKEFLNDRDFIFVLEGYMFRYMFERKNMNFAWWGLIWRGIIKYLESVNPKNKIRPGKYFNLTQKSFDKYLAGLVGSLFSFNRIDMYAILWGIPFIYEFLRDSEIISDSTYDNAIRIIDENKKVSMNLMKESLWEYSFVTKLPKPDYMTLEEWKVEKDEFIKSFTVYTKPPEPITDSVFDPFDVESDDILPVIDISKKEIEDIDYEEIPDVEYLPVRTEPKIGRNEPCPCGSGKKYKKCCMEKE